MEWSGQDRQQSVKKGDHSRRMVIMIYCRPIADNLQHTQNNDDDDDDDEVELHVLGCRLTYERQTVSNAEARFSVALRPQKP